MHECCIMLRANLCMDMHEGCIMVWANYCKDMHECCIMIRANLCKDMHERCVMLWANLAGILVEIGCWVLPRLGPLSRSMDTMVYINPLGCTSCAQFLRSG